MIDFDKSIHDIEYMYKNSFKLDISPKHDEIERFIEHVGKLANDGISDDEARRLAFTALYGV